MSVITDTTVETAHKKAKSSKTMESFHCYPERIPEYGNQKGRDLEAVSREPWKT